MSLSQQDYMLVLKIIDLASQRGFFTAPELSTIGKLYERVAEAAKAAE